MLVGVEVVSGIGAVLVGMNVVVASVGASVVESVVESSVGAMVSEVEGGDVNGMEVVSAPEVVASLKVGAVK